MMLAAVLLPVAMVLVGGCGGGGASEDKPMDQVKTDAAKMNADQLKAKVAEFTKAIDAKKADLEGVQAKIKDLQVSELMGEKAKALNAEAAKITESIGKLAERMKVYQDQMMQSMEGSGE